MKVSEMKNIGVQLAKKLNAIGVYTDMDLKSLGAENALIKLSAMEGSNVCVNMFYALEGAIRDVRWHSFTKMEKYDLLQAYKVLKTMNRDIK
jgi:DNA transformation protein